MGKKTNKFISNSNLKKKTHGKRKYKLTRKIYNMKGGSGNQTKTNYNSRRVVTVFKDEKENLPFILGVKNDYYTNISKKDKEKIYNFDLYVFQILDKTKCEKLQEGDKITHLNKKKLEGNKPESFINILNSNKSNKFFKVNVVHTNDNIIKYEDTQETSTQQAAAAAAASSNREAATPVTSNQSVSGTQTSIPTNAATPLTTATALINSVSGIPTSNLTNATENPAAAAATSSTLVKTTQPSAAAAAKPAAANSSTQVNTTQPSTAARQATPDAATTPAAATLPHSNERTVVLIPSVSPKIGFNFALYENNYYVVNSTIFPFEDGDQIITINNKPVQGMKFDKLKNLLNQQMKNIIYVKLLKQAIKLNEVAYETYEYTYEEEHIIITNNNEIPFNLGYPNIGSQIFVYNIVNNEICKTLAQGDRIIKINDFYDETQQQKKDIKKHIEELYNKIKQQNKITIIVQHVNKNVEFLTKVPFTEQIKLTKDTNDSYGFTVSISTNDRDKNVYVYSVTEDSLAYNAGLKVGYKIKINNYSNKSELLDINSLIEEEQELTITYDSNDSMKKDELRPSIEEVREVLKNYINKLRDPSNLFEINVNYYNLAILWLIIYQDIYQLFTNKLNLNSYANITNINSFFRIINYILFKADNINLKISKKNNIQDSNLTTEQKKFIQDNDFKSLDKELQEYINNNYKADWLKNYFDTTNNFAYTNYWFEARAMIID